MHTWNEKIYMSPNTMWIQSIHPTNIFDKLNSFVIWYRSAYYKYMLYYVMCIKLTHTQENSNVKRGCNRMYGTLWSLSKHVHFECFVSKNLNAINKCATQWNWPKRSKMGEWRKCGHTFYAVMAIRIWTFLSSGIFVTP